MSVNHTGPFPRAESITKITLRIVQATALIVAGAWAYNTWIKVEEPELEWLAVERDLAQRVDGRVGVCLTPIELDGVTLMSLELYVVNTGRVYLGVDTIESYVEWTEPSRYRTDSVQRTDYDFLFADTAALDDWETLAPVGILAPSDSAHGTIDFILKPLGGVYRFHAQLYLKPVDSDLADTVIVQDLTRSIPWHDWGTWAQGNAGTCSNAAPQ